MNILHFFILVAKLFCSKKLLLLCLLSRYKGLGILNSKSFFMKLRYRCISLCAGLGFGVLFLLYAFLGNKTSSEKGLYVYIDSDDNVDSVYAQIQPLVSPVQLWTLKSAAFLTNYAAHLYPGKYEIGNSQSMFRIFRNLRGGKQTPVRLVLPIVHTIEQLASRLSEVMAADSAALMKEMLSPSSLEKYGTDSFNVQCLFIPNTYEIYWTIAPEKFMDRMKREHDAFWTEERRNKAARLGLSTSQVYTLASIVQQETQNVEERPLVAGLYLNRLRKHMKLQADPTVKYALKDFTLRRISHKHLAVDNAYNTYQYEGLPPGPICIPTMNAIESVLNSVEHDYIYMCAKEDFSGSHHFSSSYQQHTRHAANYAKALNRKNIYK